MRRRLPDRHVAALLLTLAGISGCHDSAAPRNFVLSPLPTNARSLTVTLDQCDCIDCRVGVKDPVTGAGIFSQIDPTVGLDLSADPCYNDTTVTLILECGDCPGPAACTATATLRATGVVLTPSATCTTAAFAGQDCQTTSTLAIPTSVPTVGC